MTREPLELVESLGRPFSGHLGMGTVPEGHWSRTMVLSPSSLSFSGRRVENRVKNWRSGQDTDTSSIAISLRRR